MPGRALRRSLILAALCCLTLAPRVDALDPSRRLTQYVQTIWRMEEGLPHNTVRAVLQSRDGYIWLGTYGGLVRFDGVRFRVFDNRNSGLRDNEVRALAEDKDGTLWVGTTAGGLHRLVGDRLEPVDEGNVHRTINVLQVTADGSLWIGTGDGIYQRRGGKTRHFRGPTADDIPVFGMSVEANRVWIGSSKGLFVLLDGQISRVPLPADVGTDVGSVYRDREGSLWIGLITHLLQVKTAPTGSDLEVKRDWRLPQVWGSIHRLLEDRDSNLWIGTYGGGLYRIAKGELDRFSNDSGFLDHRPWCLLEDREGSLWVGTRSGLARLTDGPAVTFGLQEGLPADISRAVYEDQDGSILVATVSGFARIRGNEVKSFTGKTGAPPGVVRGFLRDRRGRLWINTESGVVRMDSDHDTFTLPIGLAEGVPTTLTRQLLEDRAGRTWLTTERGIGVADHGLLEGRLRVPDELKDLLGLTIESIFEDREGGIWIGTLINGLRRWKDGVVENEPLVPGASIGVRAFHEDQDGTMYVGTIGAGLFIRRAGEKAFRRVTTRDGLMDDAIWSILQDGDTLWLSTDRGVHRLKRSALLAFLDGRARSVVIDRVIGMRDGMKSRECNGGGGSAGLIARDGRLWFPTTRGAVVIDPKRVDSVALTPPVAIEEIVADRQMLTQADRMAVVPPGSRDVEIHYTGLSFVDPARLRFRYRLDGYANSWVDAGERRAAYFGSLPPGTYQFRVEVSFGDGAWNPNGSEITVRVQPRLTETTAFRAMATVLFIGLISGLFNLRTRQLRTSEQELQKVVAARTAELQRANEQLGLLASVDDLTGIPNHRRFVAFLGQEWLRCQRGQNPLSLLLCDIDDFKAFNDTQGHQAGDACLTKVAQTLAAVVQRTSDLAARYGGEEFAVVLPSTDEAGARGVAETIRAAVQALAIPHGASRVSPHVTVSIGCATVRPAMGQTTGTTDLISAADRALYAAKDQGRNRVVST